jgi:hypothetical protein
MFYDKKHSKIKNWNDKIKTHNLGKHRPQFKNIAARLDNLTKENEENVI